MSPNAVYLVWGSPDHKFVSEYARSPERDLDYVHYTTYYPYSYPSYGPGYGSGYGFGLTRVGFAGRHHRHGGRSFVFFGSRFYDPFFYSYIPYSVSIQGGHFRQWQGRLLPVHGTTVSLNKILSRSDKEGFSVAGRLAMAYRSFRKFLDALDQAGELKRVAVPVDTDLLIAEWANREMKSPDGGKALFFEQPIVDGKKSEFPVAI